MSIQKTVSPAKIKAVNELKELAEKYKVIGLVKMEKIGAKQIMQLRAKFRDIALIKMSKKNLMKRALTQVSDKPGLEKLIDHYTEKIGSSALIFTNEKPIRLKRLLDENKISTRAKAGDVVETDVVVPAGDTGIPPGQVISEFKAIGLPTRIKNGTINVMKDTTVLKAGDTVDFKMAAALARLNIEPINITLDLYAAWENGEILTKDILSVNIEEYKNLILEAYSNALKLSVEAGIVTPENVKLIIQKAYLNAKALALELPIIFPGLVKDYILKAQAQALALHAVVSGETTPTIQEPASETREKEKKEEKKEKEEVQEESTSLGLDDLFG
ncbi:MAG: 50S ribosomal protein L10 [Promethearchaeota archaeon]